LSSGVGLSLAPIKWHKTICDDWLQLAGNNYFYPDSPVNDLTQMAIGMKSIISVAFFVWVAAGYKPSK